MSCTGWFRLNQLGRRRGSGGGSGSSGSSSGGGASSRESLTYDESDDAIWQLFHQVPRFDPGHGGDVTAVDWNQLIAHPQRPVLTGRTACAIANLFGSVAILSVAIRHQFLIIDICCKGWPIWVKAVEIWIKLELVIVDMIPVPPSVQSSDFLVKRP